MPLFIKTGNSYRVKPDAAMVFEKKLPVGTYSVKFDPQEGFYLDVIENMTLPPKLYGNAAKNSARILNTFADRPSGTGVLLAGEKGSGKTLLAKLISAQALQMGIVTLVVNIPEAAGEAFNTFVQMIDQPAVMMFDEFEKLHSSGKNQEKMLTLLDGLYPSKKLFLITCNEKHRLNSNLIDRPGRLFYMLEFEGLGLDFVRDYCQDNLVNKQYVGQVCSISGLFSRFNFDILKALVEEMNRYGEAPSEAINYLNARPDAGRGQERFAVALFSHDKKLDPVEYGYDAHFHGDILRAPIPIRFQERPLPQQQPPQAPPQDEQVALQQLFGNEAAQEAKDDHQDTATAKTVLLKFTSRNLVKVNTKRGVYEYKHDNNDDDDKLGGGDYAHMRLVLSREPRYNGSLDLDHFCSVDAPLEEMVDSNGGGGGGTNSSSNNNNTSAGRDGQVTDIMRIDQVLGDY